MKLLIDRPIGQSDAWAEWYGEPQLCFGVDELDRYLTDYPQGDILIELRSPGGSVEQGLLIYDKLRATGRNITIEGYQLNSIASIIFLAGDTRLISSNATPVLHHPALMPWDMDGRLTAADLEAIAEGIKTLEDRMLSIYFERMGVDEGNKQTFIDKLQAEWTMSADDAILWGLATGKIEVSGGSATVKSIAFSEKALALYNKKTQKETMSKQLFEEVTGLKAMVAKALALIQGKAKAGSVTTTSETVKTLYFEGDQIETGKAVFTDESMTTAAPANTYELSDGISIVVEEVDGVSTVTSITEESDAEAKIKALEAELEAMKKEKAEVEAKAKAESEAKAAAEAKVTAMAKDLSEITAKVSALEKMIPGDTDPAKRERTAGTAPLNTEKAERVAKVKAMYWPQSK